MATVRHSNFCSFHVSARGRECGRALSNEAPLRTPGKRTCMHPPWVPARAAGGCTLLLSFHLVCYSLSLAHRGRTLPQRIISFGMPFLVSGMLTHQNQSSSHVLLFCSSIACPVCRSSQLLVPSQSVYCSGIPDMGPDHSGQKPKPAIAGDA